ncbi:MAG: deoxyribonuclease IV [Candidatus Omnitrophica bacterium]|nr:deoxyribonuclease IV [Candidatus Omnitrophota bacterium]
MLLGAHMSIAGGVDKALDRGKGVGCNVIQIFTKSNNSWQARPLSGDEVKIFFEKKEKTGIISVIAHTAYLINSATPDKALFQKSQQALITEVERAETLRIPYLIMHPGSHMGAGEKKGIQTISHCLKNVLDETKHCEVTILLETTAGQGTSLGHTFEQLAHIIGFIGSAKRIGVCFDTAHVCAAGYEFRTRKGYEKTFSRFDTIIGLEYLKVFHLNDSKKERGSRVDRHEHIGKGYLGLQPFRMLMRDKRFNNIPMILETPKAPDLAEDKMNLETLRKLVQ